jgi:aminoglycoside 3-N-acetyltransferase
MGTLTRTAPRSTHEQAPGDTGNAGFAPRATQGQPPTVTAMRATREQTPDGTAGAGPRAVHDRASLRADLAALGLPHGRDVLVHCSMRRMGYVEGGPQTLLDAVRDVIGPDATVVVPAQTSDNSTTSRAFREATKGMSEWERAEFEKAMEGFDEKTKPYRMGIFAEHVFEAGDSVRSGHPQTSFAALGPSAARLMAGHELESHLGEQSPLAALYAADAVTLLLGVGYESCTALHLAEYRLARPRARRQYHCYLKVDGGRRPQDFEGVDLDDADFPILGEAMDSEPFVRFGQIGNGQARVIHVRPAVDFAVRWMNDR